MADNKKIDSANFETKEVEEKVKEIMNRAKDVTQKAEELQYIKMPLAQLTLSDERHERERARLVKALVISIISGLLAVLLTVAGFLFYLNQFDFAEYQDETYSYSQDVDANGGGDATIEDGIHVNDNTNDSGNAEN